MITVTINRNSNGYIMEFIISGHAEYDEIGKDIVCASVSAISGAAVIGLEQLMKIEPVIDKEGKRGYLKCIIPANVPQEKIEGINIILETMVLGIKDLSKQYKKFIKVLDKEV